MIATVSPIRPGLKPCYQCAYSTRSIPMGCIRLTGTPDVRQARTPGSLCGVHGILWHKAQAIATQTTNPTLPGAA